jgi:hypothetical protein
MTYTSLLTQHCLDERYDRGQSQDCFSGCKGANTPYLENICAPQTYLVVFIRDEGWFSPVIIKRPGKQLNAFSHFIDKNLEQNRELS